MPYQYDPFLWLNGGLANPALDGPFRFFTELASADIATGLVLAALLWLERPLRRAIEVFVAFGLGHLAMGLVVLSIKVVAAAPRPLRFYEEAISRGQVAVHVLGDPLYALSFPSGHAATAMFTATFLLALYKKRIAWVLLPASLAAFSRIYVGAHFLVDVVSGATLGAIIAVLTVRAAERFAPAGRIAELRRPAAAS